MNAQHPQEQTIDTFCFNPLGYNLVRNVAKTLCATCSPRRWAFARAKKKRFYNIIIHKIFGYILNGIWSKVDLFRRRVGLYNICKLLKIIKSWYGGGKKIICIPGYRDFFWIRGEVLLYVMIRFLWGFERNFHSLTENYVTTSLQVFVSTKMY